MYRLLSTVVIAVLLPGSFSQAFAVPPPLTEGNDAETNRVLEQFIWQKIIGAPTDPKKAYQELRSSLDSISKQTNLGDQIRLPESLYMLGKSVMQPRSIRRRSSYATPTSNESTTAILSTSETSPSGHRIFSHYSNPATTNKYIPEFGAKELYQLVAPMAGDPDKEQPQLPLPPQPTQSTIQENNNNENNNNNHDQKQLDDGHQPQPSFNNRRIIDQINGQISEHQEILRKYPSKKRGYKEMQQDGNSILAIRKYNRKAVKQQSSSSQRHAISNQELDKENKPKQEIEQQQQQQQHRLPIRHRSKLKNTIRPYGGFGSDNYGNNMIGSTNYIPSSPANQLTSSSYESKRTFEMRPMMDYKGSDQMEQYPEQQQQQQQQYGPIEPTSQTLEPQIIDVVPDEQPIQIVFRSSSAKVNVKQVHTPIPYNEVETTRTEEKPQRVLHQLVRPIIQEVIEIIQPYRRVTQEIRPVLEEIRTVVAKQADTQQRIHKDRLEELYEENSIMSHRAPIYSTAISSKRSYEVKPMVIENQPVEPSVVNVDGSEQPVKVIFHTQSSPMMVRQVHTPRKPVEVERTNSVDEPHRVVHAVMRPVIQEVREIIQPYRRLTQEIRPVLEEIHTIVSKDERSEQSGSMQHSGMNGSPPAMSYASSNQQIQRSPPQSRYNNRIVDLGANDNGNLMANTQPSNGYRHRDMMVPMHSNNAIKLIRMNRDYGQDYNANNQLYAILNEQFGQQSSTGQTTSNSATNGPPILMASGSSLNYRQQMSPLPSKQISNTSNSVFGDIPIETLFNLKLNRNKKPRTQRF
ncbi:hypothetical protein DERP_009165 [Dermatophagoides pteronyssinus]|uniref:Uncharacterized protein n=1 Tax=Dermatophagoides pteronyssinus TaxID=6956 RepID=A0ABQ8JQP7_DERPT|nr:hypothetical protein DERP_009165 [Dermatophagoides pteronyssinus]